MAGRAIATNGILVVIARQGDYVIGHYDYWVPFEEPKAEHVAKEQKPRKAKKQVVEIEFE
jgi:hypothetical protein